MTKSIVLCKADYDLISRFINTRSASNDYTIKKLTVELQTAIIVEAADLPKDIVRLNSQVKLKIGPENKYLSVKLVMPSLANIKKNFVSIFSPVGAALIGYQKGDAVNWQVPAGMKTFEILEVLNE